MLSMWLSGKESDCSAGDTSSIPGLGTSPGGGRGNPRQCSCLENPMDRGAGQSMRSQKVRHDLMTKYIVCTVPLKMLS